MEKAGDDFEEGSGDEVFMFHFPKKVVMMYCIKGTREVEEDRMGHILLGHGLL